MPGNVGREEAGAKNNQVSHAAALGGVEPREPEPKTVARGGGRNPFSLRLRTLVQAGSSSSEQKEKRVYIYI